MGKGKNLAEPRIVLTGKAAEEYSRNFRAIDWSRPLPSEKRKQGSGDRKGKR